MSDQSGRNLVETQSPTERALLVGAQLKGRQEGWDLEDSLVELGQLARTAGLDVAGQTWQRLENYLAEHSDVKLSHGLCPECLAKHYPEDDD